MGVFVGPALYSLNQTFSPETCWCWSDTSGKPEQREETLRPLWPKATLSEQVENTGCWRILDHLDKTRNIRIRHPKIVKVAVSGITLNIFCESIRTRFQANLHATRFSWTYETGIGSIEGNEETEEVADLADWYYNLVEQLARAHRHNQLEELIETEHLGANRVSTPDNLGS